MNTALQLVAVLGMLVGTAAAVLWLAEGVAKLIGSRNAWLLFLAAIPFMSGVAISLFNWEHLTWFERAAIPLAGPLLAVSLLFAAFAAFNPGDALLLLCTVVRRGCSRLAHRIKGQGRDA